MSHWVWEQSWLMTKDAFHRSPRALKDMLIDLTPITEHAHMMHLHYANMAGFCYS